MDTKQTALFDELRRRYSPNPLVLRHLFLRPASPRKLQARPLSRGGLETTTRSRSFLFFAAGVAVADALGATAPLYVPENGFIGINVPLTSTGRQPQHADHASALHDRMRRVLDLLGLRHPIENPYRLLTKCEALWQNSDRDLLFDLAPATISCSHPEAPRWDKRPQGNCGYCYPCLIRRASLHRVTSDRTTYAWDALTDETLLRRSSKRGLVRDQHSPRVSGVKSGWRMS